MFFALDELYSHDQSESPGARDHGQVGDVQSHAVAPVEGLASPWVRNKCQAKGEGCHRDGHSEHPTLECQVVLSKAVTATAHKNHVLL